MPIRSASSMGVADAFVFRRVSPTRWVHLGGLGRGRGWAGLVDVDTSSDPLLTQVPSGDGELTRFDHPAAQRVLGPYYAASGAIVRVNKDVFVLLGHPSQALAPEVSEADLSRLASHLDDGLEEIRPSKRLGDELEILHAVRAATTGPAADLNGTLQHLLDVALEALSCEIGVLRDGAGNMVAIPSLPELGVELGSATQTLVTLQELAGGSSWCVQDTRAREMGAPFGSAQGACAVLAVAIPEPVGGVLVVAHTTRAPRGFTSLCQELGRQLAQAGAVVAHTAALRQELQAAAEVHALSARRDPLTGLGNRLGWDEAVAGFQDEVDAGGAGTLVTVDVDGLKSVNDTCGHDAGDELLRRCAEILRSHTRESDVCVRLGGDEFALLLPFTGILAEQRIESLRARLSAERSCDRLVAASVGVATVGPGCSVADALREADAAMYADKRFRRGELLSVPR